MNYPAASSGYQDRRRILSILALQSGGVLDPLLRNKCVRSFLQYLQGENNVYSGQSMEAALHHHGDHFSCVFRLSGKRPDACRPITQQATRIDQVA
jgi:hypothetical protein